MTTTKAAPKHPTHAELIASAPDWLKECWEASRKNGTDKLTMDEIDAEIADYRRTRASKQAGKK